jgi:DNA-binding CsgD family transcriptional regulator
LLQTKRKTALPEAFRKGPIVLGLLTTRQRDVLRLVSFGYTNREIANTLQISVRTVEVHRLNLMQRLNVRNVVQLLRRAIQLGLLSLVETSTQAAPITELVDRRENSSNACRGRLLSFRKRDSL